MVFLLCGSSVFVSLPPRGHISRSILCLYLHYYPSYIMVQAICRPLDSIKMGVYNRPSLYAFISWSLALLLSTPQLFLFYKDDQTKECTAFYAEPWMVRFSLDSLDSINILQYTVYVCVFNTVVWLLPSALAGIFYTCVCRAVWHSLAIRNTRPRERSDNNFFSSTYLGSFKASKHFSDVLMPNRANSPGNFFHFHK